jgi:Uma2 family endonuclease
MAEWIEAGVRLAWLLDPDEGTAAIYRPATPAEILPLVSELRGDPLLPGFAFRWRV